MLLGLVASREQNTRRNRRLVNVNTATPLVKRFHACLLCRAREDAECESLPRVLFREEGYSPLFLNASRGQTHQRVQNANAGHDLMRARPQQPNPIFIRRCDQRS